MTGAVLFHSLRGGDFANAGRVSTSVKRFLKENSFPEQNIQRIAIALYEAEINVVCYAYYGYFFVYITDGAIRVIVKDRGPGIEDITQAMQEGFSTASDEIRKLGFGAGMGLANIKRNSDVFIIQTEQGVGTRLEINFYTDSKHEDDKMEISFNDVYEKTHFELLTEGLDLNRTLTAGYVGDILSDVNANSKSGNIWITILVHPNAVAVAGLKELSGMIVAGGIRPGKEFIARAMEEKIPVLHTDLSAFEVASILSSMGITGNP